MKHTSEELNKKIAEIADNEEFAIKYDKSIPYIGWFWRSVDFLQKSYEFGITITSQDDEYINEDFNEDDEPLVGFMENNKWDYYYTRRTTESEWQEIIKQLEDIVDSPTKEKCQTLWDFIQNFGKEFSK
jgi:hypothetical protein